MYNSFFFFMFYLVFSCSSKHPILLVDKIDNERYNLSCMYYDEDFTGSTIAWISPDLTKVIEDVSTAPQIIDGKNATDGLRSAIEFNLPPVLDYRWKEFKSLISVNTNKADLLEDVENAAVINLSVNYKNYITITLKVRAGYLFAFVYENDTKIEFQTSKPNVPNIMDTEKIHQSYAVWRHYRIYQGTDSKYYIENSLKCNSNIAYKTFKLIKLEVTSNGLAKWKVHNYIITNSGLQDGDNILLKTAEEDTCISSIVYLSEGCQASIMICSTVDCGTVYSNTTLKENLNWTEIKVTANLPVNTDIFLRYEVKQVANAMKCNLAIRSNFLRCIRNGLSIHNLTTKDATVGCQSIRDDTNISYYTIPIENETSKVETILRDVHLNPYDRHFKKVVCKYNKCYCLHGYHGNWCNEWCQPGYWGHDCKKQCPQCIKNKCYPENGVCTEGCTFASNGTDCKILQPAAPLNFTGKVVNLYDVELHWIYPNSKGALLKYFIINETTLQRGKKHKSRTIDHQITSGEDYSFKHLIRALEPSTTYDFFVQAVNIYPGNVSNYVKIFTFPQKPIINGGAQLSCNSTVCWVTVPQITHVGVDWDLFLSIKNKSDAHGEQINSSRISNYNGDKFHIIYEQNYSTQQTAYDKLLIKRELICRCGEGSTQQCNIDLTIRSSYERNEIFETISVESVDINESSTTLWTIFSIFGLIISVIGTIAGGCAIIKYIKSRRLRYSAILDENIPLTRGINQDNVEITLKDMVKSGIQETELTSEFNTIDVHKSSLFTLPKTWMQSSCINTTMKQFDKYSYLIVKYPKLNQINIFWAMIWQKNISVIVSLLTPSELKKYIYWVDSSTTYITVKLDGKETFTDFTVDILHVTKDKIGREIRLINFMSWPNESIPMRPVSFINFLKYITNYNNGNFQYAVHFCENFNRASAFILYNNLFYCNNSTYTVMKYVQDLEDHSVPISLNYEQYKLCYFILVEKMNGIESFISRNDFVENIHNLYINKLNADFKYIKNRRYIYEVIRPRSSAEVQNVYINRLQAEGRIIATTIPQDTERNRFWNTVYNNKVTLVIVLQQLNELFWPTESNTKMHLPPLSITWISIDKGNIFYIYYLEIQHEQQPKLNTKVLYFFDWSAADLTPKVPSSFQIFYNTFTSMSSNSSNALVCCSDGITACGLLLAYDFLIQKWKLENIIDFCWAILTVKLYNQRYMENKDQHMFLYKLLHYYLKGTDTNNTHYINND